MINKYFIKMIKLTHNNNNNHLTKEAEFHFKIKIF